jgi:hypothetical protein
MNFFAIGLPSFIIALKNANTDKLRNFSKELFSFVMISAAVIIAAAFIGQLITKRYTGYTREDLQMVMLSIIIVITAANFLSIVVRKGEQNIKLYIMYAIGLVGLYSLLTLTQWDFGLIRWIKIFYEVSHLQYRYWDTAIVISVLSSLILFAVQKFREKYIKTH